MKRPINPIVSRPPTTPTNPTHNGTGKSRPISIGLMKLSMMLTKIVQPRTKTAAPVSPWLHIQAATGKPMRRTPIWIEHKTNARKARNTGNGAPANI